VLDAAGAGWIAPQDTLSPLSLATRLAALFGDPEGLRRAASQAAALGQPDAVLRLADLVEHIARKGATS
jgi:UDP-N-acetylglucosamine--N-acetylmuramyl-(pentapeptide) pyrophosphoryl-undecaprenol N-acetylglucosamine transferase